MTEPNAVGDAGAENTQDTQTAAGDQAPKATRRRAAEGPLTGKALVESLLKRKDGEAIRLLAPGGRLGDALEPSVVYGPINSTKRRIGDIRSNAWLAKQIQAGVLVIESDDAE